MSVSFTDFLGGLPSAIPRLQDPPLRVASRLAIPPGSLVVECGVFRGASLEVLARAYPDHPVLGFDSFEGLPETWDRPDMAFDRGAFALGQDERPQARHFPPNVQLVKGWFEETLPAFAAAAADAATIGFLHVDCDIYSSTRTVLESLEPLFAARTVVVFDELLNYPTYEKHEVLALFEFLRDRHPTYAVEWIGKLGAVDLHPARDNGYVDQPVACVLVRQ